MSRSILKILFYMKRGSERTSGYLPLMYRLTVDDEIKQFGCKLGVPPKLWDVKTIRTMGKNAGVQRINVMVNRIRVDMNRRYQEPMQPGGYVTAARLGGACPRLGVKCETLLKFFEQHNEEFIKRAGHNRVQGTYNRYRTIYRHLCEFVPKVYRRDDIPLKELNLTLINNFEYFLCMEKKCHTSTVWGYMIGLKRVISIIRNSGVFPFNPFAGCISPPESVDRDYSVECETQTLMETPVKNEICGLVCGPFIFSMFTGLAYADVKVLTIDRLQTLFGDNLWIITHRHKANTKSNTRLLDVPRRTIEKYEELSEDGHVLPVPSNGRYDTIPKELNRQCGLKIRLTYHVARHTNATTMLPSHSVLVETVSRLLGYTDLRTAQTYVRIINRKINSDMEILFHRLEKMEEEIRDAI